MRKLLRTLGLGLKRRGWRAALNALATVGGIWTVTEIFTRAYAPANEWLDHNGDKYIYFVIISSTISLLTYAYEPRSVKFNIPTTPTEVSLKFSDLFESRTNIVVGANEFFDCEVGHFVSKRSLHGQVIEKIYGGDKDRFKSEVDAALVGFSGNVIQRNGNSRNIAYPIGTTAILQQGGYKIFLVALSRTNPNTAKAQCDLPSYWAALLGVLHAVHNNSNGFPVTLPLLGGGLAGLNLEPQHLLRSLTLALVDFGRKHGLPDDTRIALPEACFEQLDLREIVRDWSRS